MAILNTGVLPWAPLFFLGDLGNPEESGIFGAATRMAMLVSFFVAAANTVITPKYAALIARGEMENLSYLARRTTAIVMLAASPVFLLLIIKSHWVMGLFGEDFRAGGLALAILICG
jgi:O-antigen/teichoic acid export membrane protein